MAVQVTAPPKLDKGLVVPGSFAAITKNTATGGGKDGGGGRVSGRRKMQRNKSYVYTDSTTDGC